MTNVDLLRKDTHVGSHCIIFPIHLTLCGDVSVYISDWSSMCMYACLAKFVSDRLDKYAHTKEPLAQQSTVTTALRADITTHIR